MLLTEKMHIPQLRFALHRNASVAFVFLIMLCYTINLTLEFRLVNVRDVFRMLTIVVKFQNNQIKIHHLPWYVSRMSIYIHVSRQ